MEFIRMWAPHAPASDVRIFSVCVQKKKKKKKKKKKLKNWDLGKFH